MVASFSWGSRVFLTEQDTFCSAFLWMTMDFSTSKRPLWSWESDWVTGGSCWPWTSLHTISGFGYQPVARHLTRTPPSWASSTERRGLEPEAGTKTPTSVSQTERPSRRRPSHGSFHPQPQSQGSPGERLTETSELGLELVAFLPLCLLPHMNPEPHGLSLWAHPSLVCFSGGWCCSPGEV